MTDARRKRELPLGARCLLLAAQWEEPFGMVTIEAMAGRETASAMRSLCAAGTARIA